MAPDISYDGVNTAYIDCCWSNNLGFTPVLRGKKGMIEKKHLTEGTAELVENYEIFCLNLLLKSSCQLC